mgnify:CR=1 FL=1
MTFAELVELARRVAPVTSVTMQWWQFEPGREELLYCFWDGKLKRSIEASSPEQLAAAIMVMLLAEEQAAQDAAEDGRAADEERAKEARVRL